jgi:hypothetical protein
MGAMLLRVKCSRCGKLLLEFERGAKSTAVKVQRYGTTVVRPGISKCDKCGSETPFETKHLAPHRG